MVEHHSLVDADGSIDSAVIGVLSMLKDDQVVAFKVFGPDEPRRRPRSLRRVDRRRPGVWMNDLAVGGCRWSAARRPSTISVSTSDGGSSQRSCSTTWIDA